MKDSQNPDDLQNHSSSISISTHTAEIHKLRTPQPLSLYPSTRHVLEYQTSSQKRILLRAELLQNIQDKINPYFHEKLRPSMALTYQGTALVLMISNPALAIKIQQQQRNLDRLVAHELEAFLYKYLSAKKQLHLLPELLAQLLPEGKIRLLIRPFYKNI